MNIKLVRSDWLMRSSDETYFVRFPRASHMVLRVYKEGTEHFTYISPRGQPALTERLERL